MGPSPAAWPTGRMHSTPRSASPHLSPSEVARLTPVARNRAVDLYRALAMIVVAIGHWLGMVVVLRDGELVGGNLLDFSPEYGWITWIGQVMPLFFFVGGFASAASLASAEQRGMRPADWVVTRLHRMVTPAAALGGFWVAGLAIAALLGGFGVAALAAAGAAIPLWFLANYTIDTALAPYTFRWFRERPAVLVSGLVALFVLGEVASFANVPVLGQLNWVVGWLGFQVAGFAWQQGRLPTGRRLAALAASAWVAAVVAVHLGPWPTVMLHHGGLEHSPTHPPSTALLLFGLAYSFTAAAFAPAVNRFLARSAKAWQMTIAANGVAMSVYLWHMTAAVVVAGGAPRPAPRPHRRTRHLGVVGDEARLPAGQRAPPGSDRPPRRADRAASPPWRRSDVAGRHRIDARHGRPAFGERQGVVVPTAWVAARRRGRHPRSASHRARPLRRPTRAVRGRSVPISVGHRPTEVAVGVAFGDRLALVVGLASLGEGQLHLRSTVLEVHRQGDERQVLGVDPCPQPLDLVARGGGACACAPRRGRCAPASRRRRRW